MARVVELAAPIETDRVLDVACGTGLVSKAFRSHVASITGLDLTPAMGVQATPWLDSLVIGAAEHMPFGDGEFDLTVCRQGIQFMHAEEAIREMVRTTRPGGRVVLVNLCGFGGGDEEEYFEILRLRNPARRYCFLPESLSELLRTAGCASVNVHRYTIDEDIDLWADNGAISEANRNRIRTIYREASPNFKRLHRLRYLEDGRIVDHMLFAIAIGIP
ncbi:MAG TPA: class I SAM-dependent methyltransferase [Candidatus Angelobacter sp.]|nr:class I SAM-dependent methyltransferase [Candidatus Angelobacter sp.]